MSDKFEEVWKYTAVTYLRYYADIITGGLMNAKKIVSNQTQKKSEYKERDRKDSKA
jgi:hypothetical protein